MNGKNSKLSFRSSLCASKPIGMDAALLNHLGQSEMNHKRVQYCPTKSEHDCVLMAKGPFTVAIANLKYTKLFPPTRYPPQTQTLGLLDASLGTSDSSSSESIIFRLRGAAGSPLP